MFSYQNILAGKKQKFSYTSSNNFSEISVTSNDPKSTQINFSETSTTSNFKINCGVHENDVKRLQDTVLVQSNSEGNKGLQKKNSLLRPDNTSQKTLSRMVKNQSTCKRTKLTSTKKHSNPSRLDSSITSSIISSSPDELNTVGVSRSSNISKCTRKKCTSISKRSENKESTSEMNKLINKTLSKIVKNQTSCKSRELTLSAKKHGNSTSLNSSTTSIIISSSPDESNTTAVSRSSNTSKFTRKKCSGIGKGNENKESTREINKLINTQCNTGNQIKKNRSSTVKTLKSVARVIDDTERAKSKDKKHSSAQKIDVEVPDANIPRIEKKSSKMKTKTSCKIGELTLSAKKHGKSTSLNNSITSSIISSSPDQSKTTAVSRSLNTSKCTRKIHDSIGKGNENKKYANEMNKLINTQCNTGIQIKNNRSSTVNNLKSVARVVDDRKMAESKDKKHSSVQKIDVEVSDADIPRIDMICLNGSEKSIALNNNKSYTRTIECLDNNSLKDAMEEGDSSNEKRREFLASINQAIRLQKLFTIGNQNNKSRSYIPLINALKSRGWVEKYATELSLNEKSIYSKMSEMTYRRLQECDISFVWAVNTVDFKTLKENTIVSRFPKSVHFTTKIGLCTFLEQFHWFYEKDVAEIVVPKTVIITAPDDIDYFNKKFGLSACISLLKVVVDHSAQFVEFGEVPVNIVDLANDQCLEYIQYCQHNDIDRLKDSPLTMEEWTVFLKWFYKIVHDNGSFNTTSFQQFKALRVRSKETLGKIQPYWPMFEVEGWQNLWLVKPSAQVCGRGIKVMRTLEEIVTHVEAVTDGKMGRFVVQKYIEHPLLIYNTKFDIRQWFLITRVYPLTIWFYKECYLRFSSQPFSLANLHESIHLTNNAVQKNYTNSSHRNGELPNENMWHSSTFQKYLDEIGEGDKWSTVILPGMKQGIVGAVLASQDEMIDRTNSFELYGADFLLGFDYVPILLEINMGPAMNASTAVTRDLCKRGFEDVIKVVLDTKHNPKADTGKFELLYKQELGLRPHHIGNLELCVDGTKVELNKRINKL